MRSDEALDKETFAKSEDWQFDAIEQIKKPEIDSRYEQGGVKVDEKQLRHSFSGHERNCWFHNDGAGAFANLSGLSGVDNVADGRSHVVWDFDRDGRCDIALINANEPLLNLYQNRIASKVSKASGLVAVRFVGGNRTDEPSSEFSNRDGYGAIVTLDFGDRQIIREHRCGEGFAAQNSSTMLIGIGDAENAAVSVVWPSGKITHIEGVNVGVELTVFEDPNHAPNSNGFAIRPYVNNQVSNALLNSTHRRNPVLLRGFDEILSKADMHVIVSMATWCEACKRELPQIATLRSAFSASAVGLWAVPIDPIDTSEKLTEYVAKFRPKYSLLTNLSAQQREAFQKVLRRTNPTVPLPMSVIVNSRGEVLHTMLGIPTVSDIGTAN